MSSRDPMRQWFVPGDGIDRHVISADIQRYLGNDATVRPGAGTNENQGVQGYWIKAYRNFTSAMLADLRADSARWRQEQRSTGTRDPYVGSSTYHASQASKQDRGDRRGGDSPLVDAPYGGMPPSRDPRETRETRERMPPSSSRMPVSDRMDVDPPSMSSSDRRYGQPDRGYPPDPRAYPQESRSYQPEPQMPPGYGRPPVSAPYDPEPRYAPTSGFPPGNDGAPPGYVRQGEYYVPVSTYDPTPSMTSRSQPPNYGNAYGQPVPAPQIRGDARDPRYGGQPDYDPRHADPRYAYPSPAQTVSSVSARDRENIASPPQPSSYGQAPPSSYDQYGRPSAAQPRAVQTERRGPPTSAAGATPTTGTYSPYGREATSTSNDDRERRRRRLA